ncbi:hypothetical protein HAT93_02833 [Dickeya solani]|nr:hypothetical protein [Dickeya solani]
MFNIALLGAGRIGQVHAVNIAEHRETCLYSVVDPNPSTPERCPINIRPVCKPSMRRWPIRRYTRY